MPLRSVHSCFLCVWVVRDNLFLYNAGKLITEVRRHVAQTNHEDTSLSGVPVGIIGKLLSSRVPQVLILV